VADLLGHPILVEQAVGAAGRPQLVAAAEVPEVAGTTLVARLHGAVAGSCRRHPLTVAAVAAVVPLRYS